MNFIEFHESLLYICIGMNETTPKSGAISKKMISNIIWSHFKYRITSFMELFQEYGVHSILHIDVDQRSD